MVKGFHHRADFKKFLDKVSSLSHFWCERDVDFFGPVYILHYSKRIYISEKAHGDLIWHDVWKVRQVLQSKWKWTINALFCVWSNYKLSCWRGMRGGSLAEEVIKMHELKNTMKWKLGGWHSGEVRYGRVTGVKNVVRRINQTKYCTLYIHNKVKPKSIFFHHILYIVHIFVQICRQWVAVAIIAK